MFPRDVASIDIEEFVSHRSAVGTQVLQTCGAGSPPCAACAGYVVFGEVLHFFRKADQILLVGVSADRVHVFVRSEYVEEFAGAFIVSADHYLVVECGPVFLMIEFFPSEHRTVHRHDYRSVVRDIREVLAQPRKLLGSEILLVIAFVVDAGVCRRRSRVIDIMDVVEENVMHVADIL